jgi:hypothetical protein
LILVPAAGNNSPSAAAASKSDPPIQANPAAGSAGMARPPRLIWPWVAGAAAVLLLGGVVLVLCGGVAVYFYSHRQPQTGGAADDTPLVGGSSYQTLEQLLAGLPADARPRTAADVVKAARADEWVKGHLVGKPVKLAWPRMTSTTYRADEKDKGGLRFTLSLWFGAPQTLFGCKMKTFINGVDNDWEAGYGVGPVDAATAERLAALEGKAVKVDGTLKKLHFDLLKDETTEGIVWVTLADVQVNGITLPLSK